MAFADVEFGRAGKNLLGLELFVFFVGFGGLFVEGGGLH
jgi:hypothetical protein